MALRSSRGRDSNREATAVVFGDLGVVVCVTGMEGSSTMVGEASCARGMAVLVIGTAGGYGDIVSVVWFMKRKE